MMGDTIAAVSTPRGKGGVALLRISGPEAVSVAERVFLPASGKELSALPPRTSVYGSILAPEPDGTWVTVDEGLATLFRAPASFTGEDTVELCCHGGILLTETVLAACLAAGARAAEAGEFTRRAFLSGKIGLSSAEALGELLEARTREQLQLFHHGARGRLEAAAGGLYDRLADVLAAAYAVIDYPDEDLADMSREEMAARLHEVEADLTRLCATYRAGHAIAEGIPTVICGRPNAGKSSLYNRILGEEAAIVTEIEGTTRDLLTETGSLGRVTLRLFDTAGLRESADPVEAIGIRRAREALDRAELILAVFDGSRTPDAEDVALCEELASRSIPSVALCNKSDLGDRMSHFLGERFAHVISFSASTGEGMESLTETVEALFSAGDIDTGRDAVLTNARQHGATLAALSAVRAALSALESGVPMELACSEVERGMASLGELDGRAVSEDIVSRIFTHFCVGK